MNIQYHGLPSNEVAEIRANGKDSYCNPVERHVAVEPVYPCRHCLGEIPAGKEYLILAHRPFRSNNPYAETGPIFLCADACEAHENNGATPKILRAARFLVRGYSEDERIVYGSGTVVPTGKISDYARGLLSDPQIAFVDVRSAANNCFQCRVTLG